MSDPVGLCRTCAHAHVVRTPRSVFWRCRLAEVDARFARYPRLPVLACPGWRRGEPRDDQRPRGHDPPRADRAPGDREPSGG